MHDQEFMTKHRLVRITPEVTLPPGTEVYQGVIGEDQKALFVYKDSYWSSIMVEYGDDPQLMADDLAMMLEQLQLAQDYRNGKGRRTRSVVEALHS